LYDIISIVGREFRSPHKWVGTSSPDIHAPVPDDLSGTDWQQLATPPDGTPTPNQNEFDADGYWHGKTGQYFLMDWVVSTAVSGAFNLTLRPDNPLRGPVS
jgi:hypothetical protein